MKLNRIEATHIPVEQPPIPPLENWQAWFFADGEWQFDFCRTEADCDRSLASLRVDGFESRKFHLSDQTQAVDVEAIIAGMLMDKTWDSLHPTAKVASCLRAFARLLGHEVDDT